MKEYDEDKAIDTMRQALPEGAANYSDDQLLNVIDMIWDFYEENGLLEIDDDEQNEINQDALLDDLIGYVRRMLKKDKGSNIAQEHVEALVHAEIDYENSLEQ